MKIILGSASAGRHRILHDMGYDYEVISPDINEKAIRHEDPENLVKKLAHAKASAVLKRIPRSRAILLSSDQVVVCNKIIYEKPVSCDEVFRFFDSYTRYPAETVTAVVATDVYSGARVWGVDRAKIWFKPVLAYDLFRYIAGGNPFRHAGGFDHEHPILKPYVDKIEGEPESISGLPWRLTKRLINVFYR